MLSTGSIHLVALSTSAFGSILSYELAAAYSNATEGLILTGFSVNLTYLPEPIAAWNLKSAALNEPLRFGNISLAVINNFLYNYGIANLFAGLSNSTIGVVGQNLLNGYVHGDKIASLTLSRYLTWADRGANQFTFLAPSYYDPSIATYAESTKQPVTVGEILTIGSQPMVIKMRSSAEVEYWWCCSEYSGLVVQFT
jgi:hypothetical protein